MLVFSFISPGYVEFYIDTNIFIYPLIVLGAASLLFYAQSIERSYKTKFDKVMKRLNYAFLVLLLILAVKSIAPKVLLELGRTPVMLAAIALGFIIFYSNRERLKINDELRQDEINEKRREMEFAGKFPMINRLWGIRWVARWIYKEGGWYSLLLLLILGVSFGFMLNHLGQFMSVDEPKWLHTRVPQLYESISSGDFEGTYINDKPGILPAYLSGITLQLLDHNSYTPETFENLLFWWRLPLVLFNICMLIIIYVLLKKLFDRDSAILCISFIALNPIIIGISQIVNPDATLWSTGFISILAFFLYLKTNVKKYIYISGFFLGFALLSKYFIAILYPFFLLVIVVEYLLNKKYKIRHLNTRFYDLSILSGISILVYTIFFPATWINPEQILKGTIGAEILKSGHALLMTGLFILFSDILFLKRKILNFIRLNKTIDIVIRLLSFFALIFIGYLFINLFLNYSVFNLNSFLFGFEKTAGYSKLDILQGSANISIITLTPILLLGLLTYFFIQFTKGFDFFIIRLNSNFNFFLCCGIILIFMYIIGSSIGGYITSARYQIILYPIYSLITTMVTISLIKKGDVLRIATTLIIILNIFILFGSSPFYLHYNNPLNIHSAVVTDAWGFGGYELAQEANKLPDAKNLTVWSDREGFNEFFVGKTFWRGKDNPFEKEGVDYLFLTNGGNKIFTQGLENWKIGRIYFYSKISANTPLLEYYNKTPIYQININNNLNNYVKLVQVEENK